MHIADPHVAQAVAVMIRSLQFKLANPCGNLGEEFGVSFVEASGPDQCLSASATVSVKAIAAIAGLDIGALAAKIPSFLGLTQERIEQLSILGLALSKSMVHFERLKEL